MSDEAILSGDFGGNSANADATILCHETASPEGSVGPFDVASLQAELTKSMDAATDEQQLLKQLAVLAAERTKTHWLAFFRSTHQGGSGPTIQELYGGIRGANSAAISQLCEEAAAEAAATGNACITRLEDQPSVSLVAVPLPRRAADCIVALLADRNVPPHSLATLQLVASNITTWDSERRCQQAISETQQLAALADLISRIESCDEPTEACEVLVNALRSHLGCDQVIAGLCKQDGIACHVAAISGSQTVDANCERTRLAEAVLQESIVRGDMSVWPAVGNDDRHGLCAHRQFVEAVDSEAVASTVIRGKSGEARGAWLMVGSKELIHQTETLNFALAAQRPLASALHLLTRARQNRFQRALTGLRRLRRENRGRALLSLAIVFFAVMLLPLRYRVGCECEIQPVTRRFIAAPFDGQLEKTFVEPGDVVSEQQLLARLEGREFHWELAGIEADLHGASKELAGYKVTHESGKAQIAQHEVDRLKMRHELLKHRIANLELLSPIDGIVVAGDLKKSEGVPLTMGQALFEVAPLDEMVVEVAIPEDDVRLVGRDMQISIWLDAFPVQRWDATIQRIHPRSELKNHENVFVAEVSLTNSTGQLRPGMRGIARISTVRRPFGWNLFHKAAAAALRWLGW